MSHFIVEDGTGHSLANAYATVAFITGYLTDRNRHESSGWTDLDLSVQEAAAIAATDYIENRFRNFFKGRKQYWSLTQALGLLSFTGQPTIGEQVVIGTQTYSFRSTLGPANDVLIGTSISETVFNLIAAISGADGEGSIYGTGTVAHPDVFVDSYENDSMVCHAVLGGTAGNSIITTDTVPLATWSDTTLRGGTAVGRPQPLSFPRLSLFDRDGIPVVGMPDRLLFATAEYAVRASTQNLIPDVTTDSSGFQIIKKREKVGPLEEETEFQPGGSVRVTRAYPAADALLNEYLRSAGTVVRL